MDPFYGMMSPELVDERKKREMAAALRGQATGGAALSVTDIPEVAAQGQAMQNAATTQARGIGLQQAAAMRDKRSDARALLKTMADLKASGGTGGYKISPSERKDFKKEAETWRGQSTLLDTWSPGKQIPVVGKLTGALSRMGLPLTDEAEDMNTWWAQYGEWENQARHELFGSALTATEQAAWDRTTINPKMQPSQVEKLVRAKKALIKKKAAQSAAYRLSIGHNLSEVKSNMGDTLPASAYDNLEGYMDQASQEYSDIMRDAGEEARSVDQYSDEELEAIINGR